MTTTKRINRAKPDAELVRLADSLLANYTKPEDLIGENGLLKQLTKETRIYSIFCDIRIVICFGLVS